MLFIKLGSIQMKKNYKQQCILRRFQKSDEKFNRNEALAHSGKFDAIHSIRVNSNEEKL
jgi:hypothetical protein